MENKLKWENVFTREFLGNGIAECDGITRYNNKINISERYFRDLILKST